MKLRLFQSSPPVTPAFPEDLDHPLAEAYGHAPLLPTWVYQALEFERLAQMSAQVTPEVYTFGGPPALRFLGWKLGSDQFEAPDGYGHPECILEFYWVAMHLTPEVPRTRGAHESPVGANLVQRLVSAQDPDSRPHQGVSLRGLLPTAQPPVTRWTAAGEVFRHLSPRTYPEQASTRELVVLAGEEAALCLSQGREKPDGQLRHFWDRVRRVRETRSW